MLKFTREMDFKDERVVQCDVPVVKNTFSDNCINDKNNTGVQINFDVNIKCPILEVIFEYSFSF